ncbi:hypothetical protein [Chelativorans sp. YIM 93263]|uniref:hypothetical protein n=1 Tax=Chelativorans sp. YIM 93263 TaxID=2906648 RepID=UPI0023792A0E|nr:hypothetical protein [Chelativorans sp. YIM 93263]
MTDGVIAEFAVRAVATASIVIFIAWAAVRLGPAIGGILAGLPIILAPGFYFLLHDHTPEFAARAATGSLFSLSATQVFLAAYGASARKGPLAAILFSLLAWSVVALPLSRIPHFPVVGALLFTAVTFGLHSFGRRFLDPAQPKTAGTRWSLLILRGVAAGLLVGIVTLFAPILGSSVSGLLLAFPIGFSVVALSLHLDHGGAVAGRTTHAGLVGVSSLAVFTFVLAITLRELSPAAAFAVALCASLVATALMTGMARHRQRNGSIAS